MKMPTSLTVLSEFKAQFSNGEKTVTCKIEQVWESFTQLLSAFAESKPFAPAFDALSTDDEFELTKEIYDMIDAIYTLTDWDKWCQAQDHFFDFNSRLMDLSEQDNYEQDEVTDLVKDLLDNYGYYAKNRPQLTKFIKTVCDLDLDDYCLYVQ